MSSLEFCISQEEWADASSSERKALNDQANAAYWQAFEVVHENSDWTLVETDGILGIGAIKKPSRWKGSEYDPYGGHGRASKWGSGDLHPGAMAYKRAPGVNENAGAVYPKSSTKKYPFCPTTVMDTAKEGYKSFIKQMAALGAPWADKIGVNSGIGHDEIAHAAKGPDEAAEIAAKMAADKAKKEAEEDALANAVIGEYKDIEYKEQCFLLAKIFDIIQYKSLNVEPTTIKPLPYNAGEGNSCLMAQSDPYAFMNKLTQYPTQQHLLEAKTHEIANLQPKIRLYKIMKDSNGEEYAQEFNFDSHATQNDLALMMTTAGKRGFGAGIKQFSFTYEGNNPFAVKKSISAKLSIFANTFDELLKDRGGYMYADLALKTGGSQAREALEKLNPQNADVKLDNLGKLDFRLKAVVGWAQPPNPVFSNPSIHDAINNSFITLNLTPTVHEFNFDDAGRVTFTCNYLAYVEDFFDQPAFNVFSERVVAKNIIKRKLQYKAYNEVCEANKMSEYKKQIAPEIKSDKNLSLRSIFTLLSKYDRLNYINLPWGHLLTFKQEGPYFNMEDATGFEMGKVSASGRVGLAKTIIESQSGPAQDQVKDEGFLSSAWESIKSLVSDSAEEDKRTEKEKMISKITKDAETEQIVFFYLSDLIDVILKGMEDKLSAYDSIMAEAKEELKDVSDELIEKEKEKSKQYYENFKKFRVLLGPVEIVNPANASKSMVVNFGDIPISLRYFLDWLGEKTIKRDEATYPLPKFLNDLMNNLVRDFLNNDSCFGYSIKQKTRVNQASITAYSDGGYEGTGLDPVAGKIGEHRMDAEMNTISRLYMDYMQADAFPILNVSGIRDDPRASKSHHDEFNFLVYFAARTQPVERMNGNYHEDIANGILHYMLGKDRGIIKNIQLQKTDSPGLKEVRFEQEGFDGLNQLREVYDVTIDTYANVNAFPGVYLFVDPRGFVPNMSYEVREEGFNIEDLSDYGLGGYYMIIRSEHTFGPGKADTKITAKWVNEIHKELDKRDKKRVKLGKAPKDTPKKCGILTQERKQGESSWFSNLMGSELKPSTPKDTVSKPGPESS